MDPTEFTIIYSDPETTTIALSGGVAAAVFYALRFVELLAKLIPDDARGAPGLFRKIAKILSIYTVNRTR